MGLKETAIMGCAGAAAIYLVRSMGGEKGPLTAAAPYDKGAIKLFSPTLMAKNDWSAVFWIAPAVGAWYLSR